MVFRAKPHVYAFAPIWIIEVMAMKSLSDLPRLPKPPEEEAKTDETAALDGSILLLALLLSRMEERSELIQSLASHLPDGEKLRLALKFGSELKRSWGGLSSLRVVARYTKRDMGSIERALARSEELRKTLERLRAGGRLEALASLAGINPLIAAMLNNPGALSPEMLMNLMNRRTG